MASLKLENITKRFSSLQHDTIADFSLSIKDGEFVVFVGPSGCGKSTLLRMIAGLEEVTEGTISLDNSDITEVRPSRRNMAMVFQSYALYPHMNVRENMAFALKLAKINSGEINNRVTNAANMLGLTEYLTTKPKNLSGGQRQRVAIGRAIVREPQLFLFDEPLSNLDATLRVQTRIELSLLHKRLKTTMIYVTHDQVEAMTLAERIVVLNGGQLEQMGSPDEIYQKPNNLFVAGFIGSPKMSFLKTTVKSVHKQKLVVTLANGKDLELPVDITSAPIKVSPQTTLTIGIRPEDLVTSKQKDKTKSSFNGEIQLMENLGSDTFLHVQLDKSAEAESVTARLQEDKKHFTTGETVTLSPNIEKLHLFDSSGTNIFK